MLTDFKTNHWNSRWWRIKAVWRAMKFAYRNPRHVQIAVTLDEDGFKMHSNYSGLNEKGHMRVLEEVGEEVKIMKMTEREFKNMMN